MDIVIKDVATGSILNINDTALLKKTDIFNDVEQTQIKIGKNAGVTQAPNSIILNATGDVLNNNAMNDNGTCVIAPIRAQNVASHFLTYDDTTKEIVKSTVAQARASIVSSHSHCLQFEKNGPGSVGHFMSVGNGTQHLHGMCMPTAGVIYTGTLYTQGLLGTHTVAVAVNGVSTNRTLSHTVPGTTAGNRQDISNWAPLSFNAGDRLTFTHSAIGSETVGSVALMFVSLSI